MAHSFIQLDVTICECEWVRNSIFSFVLFYSLFILLLVSFYFFVVVVVYFVG